jgi:uncharacterized linocin/CFP29 family protein
MNHLFRDLAPITATAWSQIEAEATRSLTHFLAARKLVDFTGPLGWEAACLATGRAEALDQNDELPGVETCRRQSLSLLELRVPFTLDRGELDRAERGATDVDLSAVVEAARRAAAAEDTLVFRGVPGSSPGLIEATPHEPIPLGDDYARYPQAVALAVATLKDAGVAGPYAIALGPRCYRGVIETTEHGGYPLLEHLRVILGGPVVWAPAVDGAVVLSQRGDDIELVVGQDFAIGYRHHDADSVTLYLEETAAVRLASPEAAIRLSY